MFQQERLNHRGALWLRNPKEVSSEEYTDFYRSLLQVCPVNVHSVEYAPELFGSHKAPKIEVIYPTDSVSYVICMPCTQVHWRSGPKVQTPYSGCLHPNRKTLWVISHSFSVCDKPESGSRAHDFGCVRA